MTIKVAITHEQAMYILTHRPPPEIRRIIEKALEKCDDWFE